MKFDQSIEYNKRNIFLQKLCRKPGMETTFRFFLFFLRKKALYEVKPSGLQLCFNIFQYLLTWHTIKTNWVKL